MAASAMAMLFSKGVVFPHPSKSPKWRDQSPIKVKCGRKRVSFSMRYVLPQTGNTCKKSCVSAAS